MIYHKKKVLVEGDWIIVDPKVDAYYGRGKSRIHTHYIPGAREGKDALNYRLNGPYPVVMHISNYKALMKDCVERYGLATVLRRVPLRAKKIVVRAADELIESSRKASGKVQ